MSSRRPVTGALLAGVVLAGCTVAPGGPVGQPAKPTPTTTAALPTSSATPIRSITPTTPTAPSCPGTACVSLALTGDVLLHPPLWAQARRDAGGRGYDFRPLLAAQRRHLEFVDLAICHLETPLGAPGGPFRGYPSFVVPPQVASALRTTGYDACTTASNHTLDDGTRGVERTLAALEAAGLRYAGSARSPAEAARTTLLDVRGTRVALLSYTYGFNGGSSPQAWRVAVLTPARVVADARRARGQGADVVVVAAHWGTEYLAQPTAAQRRLARAVLASGQVDLLYGHHAHVVQPVEKVGDRWVVWGLGNSVAAHSRVDEANREGLLVRVQLVRGADGRWRGGRLGWVASYVGRTRPGEPYRWVDVRAALADPAALTPAQRAAYQRVSARVDRVAGSLGGTAEGAGPVSP